MAVGFALAAVSLGFLSFSAGHIPLLRGVGCGMTSATLFASRNLAGPETLDVDGLQNGSRISPALSVRH
jgi:hypothetical protein